MVTPVSEQIKELKDSLSKGMVALKDAASKDGFSSPSKSFIAAEEGLKQDDFTIVVFGEQKNGKSSFVNALLGKSILPVGVEVTTSQAFKITNAEEESFFLVFADGLRQQITAAELARYGKETDKGLDEDIKTHGRTLLYIEVNTPAAFLPKGVHLLDTPGLGALYPEHAKVTNRCLGIANAAIFIKDVESPIKETELGFIKSAFSITKNIMFVLNKVDVKDVEQRKVLLGRNEELLNKEFKSIAGRDLKMWPFSSKLLLQAASETNLDYQEEDKEDAGYTALFAAIRALIDKTAGFNGCYVACQESFNYYKTIDGTINDQIQVLGATDASERKRLVQSKQQLQSEFLKEWGPNGTQIRAINDKVNDICRQGNQMLQGIFGEVQRSFVSEIDELPVDMEQIQEYSDSLPGRISARIEYKWNEIITDVIANIRNMSQSMNVYGVDASTGALGEVNHGKLKFSDMVGAFTGASVALMIGGAIATLIFPPIGIVGGLIGFFLGGKTILNERRAAAAKQEMKSFASSAVAKCQQNLLFPPSVAQKSQASLFFDGIKQQVASTCAGLVEEEKARLEAEFADLEVKAQMNVDEAKERISALTAARNGLAEIKTLLLASRDKLMAISEQLQF